MVVVATVLGDLTSAQMRLIGELASAYGDGTVRITSDQNLVFRWIRSRDVEALYRSLTPPDCRAAVRVRSRTSRAALERSRASSR